MDSYGERLKKIQTAIDDILTTGQSYEIDGKKYTKANLRELYEIEKRYIDLVQKYGDKANVLSKPQKRVVNVSFVG
jgi:Mg2+ and Co2+ transporter CorA